MPQLSDEALRQGELWGAAVKDWVETQERTFTPLFEAVLDAVGVEAGSKYLDAGCGTGGACRIAEKRGADVHGFDVSVPMITVARERMPTCDFRIAELRNIPFPNDEFDRVTAINCIQFAADPQLAVHELGRVCKTGGLIGIVVFAPREQCDLRFISQAIIDLFPTKPSGAGPFALSGMGELEAVVRATDGLAIKDVIEIACPFEYADMDLALRGQLCAGGSVRAVQILGRDRVADAVRKELRRFERPDGRVIMNNRFRCIVAGKQ